MESEEKKVKVSTSDDKLKALQAAMDKIEKSYGKGSIMKLGDDRIVEVAVIPTGS
ncbi:MAG: DNA recombination/repair protein RecA, partial [Bacteroidales bacterium]